MQLTALGTPTCICNTGIKGSINGVPFSKNCLPEPSADLIQQKNPTCWVDTYQGKLGPNFLKILVSLTKSDIGGAQALPISILVVLKHHQYPDFVV